MDALKEPSGKQDPYIGSFGGFICLDINKSGEVKVENLKISHNVSLELNNNLLFFFTGLKRDASNVLNNQKIAIEKDKGKAIEAMHKIKEIGFQVKRALEKGDITEFGRLQHEHWIAKRAITKTMSNSYIDQWYNLAIKNGASGGKIMGAGGGGFLMMLHSLLRDYTTDRYKNKTLSK